jgi:hypothetical protein
MVPRRTSCHDDPSFEHVACAPLSLPPSGNWKRCRPTMGKRQQLKLLGYQLVAVDENQTARVERHRPSPRGANYMVVSDVHCMPRQIAEVLDHSAADLAVRPRIDTHPRIHRHGAIADITSRPASAFRRSSHPSSPLRRDSRQRAGGRLHLLDPPAQLVG